MCQILKLLRIAWVLILPSLLFSQINLPLEVMGADGTKEEIVFQLNNPQNAEGIKLSTHNVNYSQKMSVRLNGGTWTRVNNNNINLDEKSKIYGGVGGLFTHLKFDFPISGFVSGENKIEFRFNQTDGVSSGFRILKFNVLGNQGGNLIAENNFNYEDPIQWSSPLNNPSDIAAGKKLWNQDGLKDAGGTSIRATCADCHTQSGMDLEYFAFSNHSIIERSKWHGLTQTEGEQIASYIRSIDVPRHGRPWNPPYQPGKALDNQPIEKWAAGAGIDAVLEDDSEMYPELFPNGSSPSEIAKIFSLDSVLDVTELPVAIPFFDWNGWLPRTHPKDIWPGGEFENNAPLKTYENVVQEFSTNLNNQYIRDGKMIKHLNSFQKDVKTWIGVGKSGTKDNWRGMDGTNLDARDRANYSREDAKLNLVRWMATKYFEIMQEFEIEHKAHLYFNTNNGVEGHRQWPMNNRSVFELAPHFLADNWENFENQPLVEGQLFSSTWYNMQMILNSGEYGLSVKGAPMDWTYHYTHIWGGQDAGAPYEGFRTITSLLKMWQERTNGKFGNDGFRIRYLHPMYMWGARTYDEGNMEMLNSTDPDLRAKLYTELMTGWVEKVNEFPISDWPRAESGDWLTLEWEDHVPSEDIDNLGNNNFWATSKHNHADYFYRLMPKLMELGVDCNPTNDLIDWLEQVWPLGDWRSRWYEDDCDDYVTLNGVELKVSDQYIQSIENSNSILVHPNGKSGVLKVLNVQGEVLSELQISGNSIQQLLPSNSVVILELVLEGGVRRVHNRMTY